MQLRAASGLFVGLALLAGGMSGCQPTFSSEGTLTIDGSDFRAVSCHVLTGATGIELEDATHTRLALTLPPATVDAFKDVTGAPRMRFDVSGKAARTFGPCGTLVLTGEGYHAAGKRAATGKVSLACTGDMTAKGELTFKGCF